MFDPAIELTCPKCGVEVEVAISAIAAEQKMECPKGHFIQLREKDGKAKEAKQATDHLEAAAKRIRDSE